MDDPRGQPGGHGNQLQKSTMSVGADHEQPLLPVVLVLDEADRVEPCMLDFGVHDPVLARGTADLYASSLS